jgi:hypothetical protein
MVIVHAVLCENDIAQRKQTVLYVNDIVQFRHAGKHTNDFCAI